MNIYQPSYYERFHCLASKCPDSCCKEWEVEVDDASAECYRNLRGPLGDRLRQVLVDTPQWGTVMQIENGRCPMWQQDGLCRIQSELGHDALCKTCRDFPRLCHDYGHFQEWGLELSCPEAARLILNDTEHYTVCKELSGSDEPDYDEELMQLLLQTREEVLSIVDTFAYTIPQLLSLLLFYGYHVQSVIDGAEMLSFAADAHLDQACRLALTGGEAALLDFFQQLDCLTPVWKIRLQHPSPSSWDERYRNLVRYFVNRYWLQAVSDYDLVSRVKFILISCVTIHLLGGDLISTAQLYSKEIENSSENVDAILDAAYQHPAFADRKLFGLLI